MGFRWCLLWEVRLALRGLPSPPSLTLLVVRCRSSLTLSVHVTHAVRVCVTSSASVASAQLGSTLLITMSLYIAYAVLFLRCSVLPDSS